MFAASFTASPRYLSAPNHLALIPLHTPVLLPIPFLNLGLNKRQRQIIPPLVTLRAKPIIEALRALVAVARQPVHGIAALSRTGRCDSEEELPAVALTSGRGEDEKVLMQRG